MRKFLVFLMALTLMLVTVFPAVAQDTNTIADVVTAATEADKPEFTILSQAIATSERLTEALSDPESELTVFAPTDAAFEKFFELAEISADEMLAVPEVVEAVLLYHVVDGVVPAETVMEMDGEEVPTLLGDFAPVTIQISEDGDVMIIDGTDLAELGVAEEDNDATVVTPDIEADNGIIHAIDNVLIPGDQMLAEHFAMQDDMMGEESMDGDMGDADDTMSESDMADVLGNTIADIVVTSTQADEPEFTVLLAALQAADESILTTLSDPEAELTVFAPTDEAFAALLDQLDMDAETLLADTDLLNRVLQYHVVEGVVMADQAAAMDGELVPTLLGNNATISISVTDDAVVLNDSIHVVQTDIAADNGVIHVIDGVLLPPSDE